MTKRVPSMPQVKGAAPGFSSKPPDRLTVGLQRPRPAPWASLAGDFRARSSGSQPLSHNSWIRNCRISFSLIVFNPIFAMIDLNWAWRPTAA